MFIFLKISLSYQPAGLAGTFPDSGPKLKRIFLTSKPVAAMFRVLPLSTAKGRQRAGITAFYRFLSQGATAFGMVLFGFGYGLVRETLWFVRGAPNNSRTKLPANPCETRCQKSIKTVFMKKLTNPSNRIIYGQIVTIRNRYS
ncbi:hypothetical protein HYN48_09580 [Flavobacterium magnum]|uniref:Uncharacterized protein n=1 Tax=Flavobacterium magnum TaxID=2162713 RepID=A0A2S0RFB0_9FLAO|nr:hypothetical protein [Flavobacterium magnum]AWA30315.1 hypothetical protein HYN48_09580 [Flavobacterium magnum]